MNTKKISMIKWLARICPSIILVLGLLFYSGYGNPLPFIDEEYSIHDNIWLTVFPLMFIGLISGWKCEKLGGHIVVIPLLIGFTTSIFLGQSFGLHLIVPFIVGILYLIVGYSQ